MDIGHENFAADDAGIGPFVALTHNRDVARLGFAKKHFGIPAIILIELVNIFVAHRCNVKVALCVLGQSHRVFNVGRSNGLNTGITDRHGQNFGIGGILNKQQSVFALLPNDGGGFGEVADPDRCMGRVGCCGGECRFINAASNAVGGIKDLGDGVVGAVLNLTNATDCFGADDVANGIVDDHATRVEDEHGVSNGEFMKGDISGRFQVFGKQGFITSTIDLKDFATALIGDQVAIIEWVIGRCVGGVEIILCIGSARESEQEAN